MASSLTLQSYSTTATIAVTFGPDAGVGMSVPLDGGAVSRQVQRARHGHREVLAVPPVQGRNLDRNPLSV